MRAQLQDVGVEVGVELDGGQLDRLLELVRLWRAYAPAINLVGAHDDVAMFGHVADGLATIACAGRTIPLGPAVTWLDVGAGAGLPGLVVAAAGDCHVVLAEPRQKRAAFLELAIATIAAKAEVIRVRIDEETWSQVASKQEIRADLTRISITSARAVLAVESWLRLGEKLVMTGGVVIAHVRPEVTIAGVGAPTTEVIWGRSKILAFATPLAECST